MISNVNKEELRFRRIRLERIEKILDSNVSYHTKISATNYVYRCLFENDENIGIFFDEKDDCVTFELESGEIVVFYGSSYYRMF